MFRLSVFSLLENPFALFISDRKAFRYIYYLAVIMVLVFIPVHKDSFYFFLKGKQYRMYLFT